MWLLGSLPYDRGNENEAAELFQQAAVEGHQEAEFSLGVLFARRGAYEEARVWL